MLVTRETSQFERSLLNFPANVNTVSIIQITELQKKRQNDKREKIKIKKLSIQKRKRNKINCYVLRYMLVTRETTHFEISLFIIYAP